MEGDWTEGTRGKGRAGWEEVAGRVNNSQGKGEKVSTSQKYKGWGVSTNQRVTTDQAQSNQDSHIGGGWGEERLGKE